jgi:hypothetical protein
MNAKLDLIRRGTIVALSRAILPLAVAFAAGCSMENQPYAPTAKAFTSYADLAKAVEEDPNAIGYSSMPLAAIAGVTAVRIGRQEPNALAVNEGWYPYARTCGFSRTRRVKLLRVETSSGSSNSVPARTSSIISASFAVSRNG